MCTCFYSHCSHIVYAPVYIRAWKRVPFFKHSFVWCRLEAKFLPSKLCCYTLFNVRTFALLQSKCMVNNVGVFQKS